MLGYIFFFFFKDFIYPSMRDTERGRDTGRGRSRLSVGSPGLCPESKADVQLLSHPSVPRIPFFLKGRVTICCADTPATMYLSVICGWTFEPLLPPGYCEWHCHGHRCVNTCLRSCFPFFWASAQKWDCESYGSSTFSFFEEPL